MTGDMIKRISENPELIYHTREWKKKRLEILKRDNWECQRCLGRLGKIKRIKLTKADTVHHKITLEDCSSLAFDDDNLISLCRSCHDEIHGRNVNKFNQPKKRLNIERW